MRGEHVVSVNENRGNVRDLALRLVKCKRPVAKTRFTASCVHTHTSGYIYRTRSVNPNETTTQAQSTVHIKESHMFTTRCTTIYNARVAHI